MTIAAPTRSVDPVPRTGPLRPLLVGMTWFENQPGGLNRYVDSLHAALLDVGCPAAVLAAGRSAVPDASRIGVDALDPARKLLGLARRAGGASRDATVLDVHFALHGAAVLRHPAARAMPLVVHFHGPWASESAVQGVGSVNSAVRRRIEQFVYRRAERIVTLSQAFGDLVVADYGVDPSVVSVLAPGVDLDRFSPGDRRQARSNMGLDPHRPTVVCVRRLARRMGIDDLLKAWPLVLDAVPTAQLVVVGDGPERAALQGQAAALPGDSVRFLGRVADDLLPDVYRAADLSVVPTRALEGFGLITLESYASGVPVVVTDAGGLDELPRRLDPSAVVPVGDPRALGGRISSALRGTRTLVDHQGCRFFAEQYAWSSVAKRHVDLYRSVHSAADDHPRTRRPPR